MPTSPNEQTPTPPPAPGDVQATFAATLVDEWVRDGLTDAVVCPGSRSTPLALALAEHPGVRVHVHHDERSGAFLALGLGLADRRPAVVLTTSGTAAAELHPAVVEADLAAVPLLACTADRPPELRDVGAPQAIDQVHVFGRSARWYGDPGVPEAAGAGRWRAFAARAYATTLAPRPGPVHLNLPFREPLVGSPGALPPARDDGPWTSVVGAPAALPAFGGAADGVDQGGVGPQLALPADVGALVDRLARCARGLIVAGAADIDGVALHDVALALGWPVVAEPRSPAWVAGPALVEHVDAVVRSSRATAALRPDVIVRVGAPGSSRVVEEWLAASGADHVVVGASGWSDPSATVAVQVTTDPGPFLTGLRRAAEARPADAGDPDRHDGSWAARWRAAAVAAADAVDRALGDVPAAATPGPPGRPGRPGSSPSAAVTEPAVARAVVRALPGGAHLVVSSSMPIRDVERYARARPGRSQRAVTVHANRGANGIDGVVSTAVGVAAGTGAPTALLIGDVAFLHDSNGLLGAAGRGLDLVCVVVDNDGGGIFSFLPQARALASDRFESLFGTPHGLDLVALASAYGVAARRLAQGDDVASAVAAAASEGGVHVLVVGTDRAANVDVHRRVDGAVAAAVDRALARG
ncbi:MAG TPA: 2-succinyl-5-enolpyruvyl-6-hydroxy-3-cyclohexene-1-carboxylic-acid synthase [Acidimicrobiales bacterium]|nr:2-succinyl-5-enolpyruvyl-6-hydroxy-3-cyclohexene-1-carboxylic-acid synthase [Acidimicrobiales bacterium]